MEKIAFIKRLIFVGWFRNHNPVLKAAKFFVLFQPNSSVFLHFDLRAEGREFDTQSIRVIFIVFLKSST